ncbi:putative dual specificity protein phosphatase [Cryptosporidium felis]|nr:putative dual specificity protein phosphatase [Cryptosporidium felis]
MESSSEAELIRPERVNFYFAALRVLRQIRKMPPQPMENMRVQETIGLVCTLEQATSAYGMLVTSPRGAGEEAYEERIEEFMRTILSCVNRLGFRDALRKEVQFSNKENLDLHKAQRIIPGVFLGGSCVAQDLNKLKELGITHIVSCLQGSCKFPKDFIYLNIPVYDTPFEDISRYFSSSYEFIHNALCNSAAGTQNNVYIHCAAGISRAPTICASFLMRELGISSLQALQLIRESRPYIAPNAGFLGQLHNYQSFLESINIYKDADQVPRPGPTKIQQGVPCQTSWRRNVGKAPR